MSTFRLDQFLSDSGYSQSREKAKREIISGWVKVNGETVREPSKKINGKEDIIIERPGGVYVSRGGEKLHKALKYFNIEVKGKAAADLGASTGGFTHCLIKHGAAAVYAVDVGYGQLDYSLRNNKKITVYERTHVNSLTSEHFKHNIDIVTADLSFISLTRVIEIILELFNGSECLILIKPQFEAESGEHKKGVVRKKEDHIAILNRVIPDLLSRGVSLKGLTFSPIKGPKGNIEFLLYCIIDMDNRSDIQAEDLNEIIVKIVEEAHDELSQ